MTVAIANGFAITLDKDAHRRWVSSRRSRQPQQSSADFSATIGRLAARFPGKVGAIQ